MRDPIPFSAVFSEPVFNFAVTDISAPGHTVSNFVAVHPTLYTFSVDASSPVASVAVGVAASVATDYVGNANNGASLTITLVDKTPSVALSCDVEGYTNDSPFLCVATWDEAIIGFDASDLLVTNGDLSGSNTYSFLLSACFLFARPLLLCRICASELECLCLVFRDIACAVVRGVQCGRVGWRCISRRLIQPTQHQ